MVLDFMNYELYRIRLKGVRLTRAVLQKLSSLLVKEIQTTRTPHNTS